ncbi:amphi-Trp domain-containing protein [Streptomyces sp. NRRL WC-3618]|uniref:amphi-Trp domain-containing protein n=1 Tax=Streptomyces sp. NRRL WC-3618 TaxID=1519490 RepID=UPI00099CDF72|nr:amphi-Trp domain-containing protein [Streptomyces sp. NRRL WC-3618]
MKDLKFEQKRSLSRLEAADQLTAIAAALREGGEAELKLSPGTLSLRVPEDLRSEIEVEIGDGEIELEIELKWPTTPTRTELPRTGADPEEATRRKEGARQAGAQQYRHQRKQEREAVRHEGVLSSARTSDRP